VILEAKSVIFCHHHCRHRHHRRHRQRRRSPRRLWYEHGNTAHTMTTQQYHCCISRTAGPSLILSSVPIWYARTKPKLCWSRETRHYIVALFVRGRHWMLLLFSRDCNSLSGQVVRIHWAFFFQFLFLFISSLAFWELVNDLIWSCLWKYRVHLSWAYSQIFIHYSSPEWNWNSPMVEV